MSGVPEIRELMVRGQLMGAGAADELIERWRAQAGEGREAADLMRWLVAEGVVTEFEAQAILAGRAGPYRVGPYRLQRELAAGRLGTVFAAVHEELGQSVSLKVFPRSVTERAEKLARVQREARVAVEVDHPNVVRCFHVGRVGETYFLAFEQLEGQTLAGVLEREGRLPSERACELVRQAALGLDHLHRRGVVHRDVQPASLWVAASGRVKVMEFGAARDALEHLDTGGEGEPLTISSTVLGTYDYMAPEQARDPHAADARSDIYSLGCTLYRCLTGQLPFPERNPVRQMMRHATEQPRGVTDLAPDVPHGVAEVVATMMAKRPEDRYQKAADVAWALEHFVAQPADLSAQEPEPSREYLDWARSAESAAADQLTPSPQLAAFLDWLAEQ